MTVKDIIASCLVIALGIILALHFAFFWIYGGVFIYESNKVILSIETGMSATILVFGIERLISAAKSMDGSKASTVATVAGKKIRAQSPTKIKLAPKAMPQGNIATIAATTTLSAMPLNTVLSTDSDAKSWKRTF